MAGVEPWAIVCSPLSWKARWLFTCKLSKSGLELSLSRGGGTSLGPPAMPACGILELESCLRMVFAECNVNFTFQTLPHFLQLQEVLPRSNPTGNMCPEASIQLEEACLTLRRQLVRLAAEPPMSGTQ